MPVSMTVDSLDGVDESIRGMYRETGDGRFALDIDGMVSSEEISGLRSALEKEREERRKAKSELSKFREAGIDLDEFQTLKEESAKKEMDIAEKRGEFERLRQAMLDDHSKTVQGMEQKYTSVLSELKTTKIESESLTHITDLKGNPALLMPKIRESVDYREYDGVNQVVVLDSSGNVRITKDGRPMGIRGLVSELREDATWGAAFEPTGKVGSDSPIVQRRGNQNLRNDPSKMGAMEKIRAGLESQQS